MVTFSYALDPLDFTNACSESSLTCAVITCYSISELVCFRDLRLDSITRILCVKAFDT